MNMRDLTFKPSKQLINIARICTLIGLSVFLIGLFVDWNRTWANVHVVSLYFVGIGLGVGFFVALIHLTGGKWARNILFIPENLWVYLTVGAVGVMLVLLVGFNIFPWVNPTEQVQHVLKSFKGTWLNYPFVVIRGFIFFALWIYVLKNCITASRTQSKSIGRWSAGLIVLIMLTIWMAATDWVMSFDPEWFSTMFGFYLFTGFFSSAIAVIILVGLYLRKLGLLTDIFTDDHLHDLGKLQFGFCTFWMYIWFSQYMLIWYTNNPEETNYFVARMQGAWAPLLLLNLFLNWIVPFFVLLSARAKKNGFILAQVSVVILVGHWLDLNIMIIPSVIGDAFPISIWEIGIALGGVGIFMYMFMESYIPKQIPDATPSVA